MNDNVELARKLNGAHLQNARTRSRHFQHVVVAYFVYLARAGANAGVGRIHAVDIG
jgi:hypothetical protein